jgi:hypothetical protein
MLGRSVSWADLEALYHLHLILKTMYKIRITNITVTLHYLQLYLYTYKYNYMFHDSQNLKHMT